MLELFEHLDLSALYEIALRVVSVETVTDAREFAAKVREASEIVIAAGLRIAGRTPDGGARSVMTAEQERAVERVVNIYQGLWAEEA